MDNAMSTGWKKSNADVATMLQIRIAMKRARGATVNATQIAVYERVARDAIADAQRELFGEE